MTTLLRTSEPIPFNQSVARTYSIPAITPYKVAVGRIDVTTYSDGDGWPRFIEAGARAYGGDGELIFRGSREEVRLAIDGGGEFHLLTPNDTAYVESRKEYRARRKREKEAAERRDAESNGWY